MLVFGRCLLLFHFSILIQLSYQLNMCQDSSSACVDCFDWCPTQKQQCENLIIKSLCRVTCTACTSNNPVCLQLNCAQRCILPNTTSSDSVQARCGCFEGFELDTDGRSCIDINECEREPSICNNVMGATLCRNQQGSYACISCQAIQPERIWSYYERSECCLRNRNSTCGKGATYGGRIVYGDNAAIQYWPWMAYIRVGSNLCGGTLISENHILTAAHCVATIANTPGNVLILMGVVDIRDQTNVHAQTLRAKKITVHPNYRFPDNDIAVIELNTSVTTTNFVQLVCLPGGETPRDGDTCYATGFGSTSAGDAASPVLQQVDLPIVNISVCQQAYENRTHDIDPALHICAGYTEGGKDACQGDSGGPLVCQRCANCDWYLAGITSFGRGCARPGFYGVYTNVTRYESWISEVTSMPQEQQGQCVKPSWHEWGPWSACSVTCGIGERMRVRFCMNGQVNEPGCMGEDTMHAQCNAVACTGEWSVFGPWSACERTCGISRQVRTRTCLPGRPSDLECPGLPTEIQNCTIPPNCPTWGPFTINDDCSVTCGGGIQTSSRVCNDGEVADVGCQGPTTREEICNTRRCPTWGRFTRSGECSANCGEGIQRYSRVCLYGEPGEIGCQGPTTNEETCSTRRCPTWGRFTRSGECSATCGEGMQRYSRMCLYGEPGEIGCQGPTTNEETCSTKLCTIWGPFTSFGNCSVSCGGGTQTYTRECINGEEGDEGCMGSSSKIEVCNNFTCPAEWNNWSDYSQCSAHCGGGTQERNRTCNGGEPGTGNCIGNIVDARSCNTHGGGRRCCRLHDVLNITTCRLFVSFGWCDLYLDYMERHCNLACCERSYGPVRIPEPTTRPATPVSPVCRDNINYCFSFLCNFPNYVRDCSATCGLCS